MPSILRPLTLEEVKHVLGRALIDPDFRAKLTADPKEVLSILGFEVSQQGIDFFKNLKGSDFDDAGKSIDGALTKNGPGGWA